MGYINVYTMPEWWEPVNSFRPYVNRMSEAEARAHHMRLNAKYKPAEVKKLCQESPTTLRSDTGS